MDQSEIVVSFKLDAEEARRQAADLQKKAGVTKTTIRIQSSVAVLWVVIGIVEVAANHNRSPGWFYIVGGCFYVFAAYSLRSSIIKVPPDVETCIRFGAAGIVVEHPAPQSLSWSAVEGVNRYRGALILRFQASEIKPPLEQRIVIPTKTLPDGGIALWQLCEQMLLGPLRRVSAQMSADETGALRRTDAMHIANVRARRASTMRQRLPAQSVSQS